MIITTSSIEEWNPCIPQEGWLDEMKNYFLSNVVNFQSSGSLNIGHITSSWQHTTSSIEVHSGTIYAYSGSKYDYNLAVWMTQKSNMTCSFYNVDTQTTELIYNNKEKIASPKPSTPYNEMHPNFKK